MKMNASRTLFRKIFISVALIILAVCVLPGWLFVPIQRARAAVVQPQILERDPDYPSQVTPPLATLLHPNGSINLSTGYRGVLDPTGWILRAGIQGEPRFLAQTNPEDLQSSSLLAPGDENWVQGFQIPGTNGDVLALVLDGSGNMYIGGSFTKVGGMDADRIARWDGTTWSTLGSGMDNTVYTLYWDGNHLYAGGDFNTAGDVPASRIARWDGANWSPLSTGMSAAVYTLAMDGSGNLYAGGTFLTAGGTTVNRIARWDGADWFALGSGMSSSVYSLVFEPSGQLYAGGSFYTAGGVTVNRIARWDGNSWMPLGSGLNSTVYTLAWRNSQLYAGGAFTQSGRVTLNYIGRWNGTSWSPVGTGMDRSVRMLVFDEQGILYAGGNFRVAGGVSVNRIARWNGINWLGLSNGMPSGTVRAIALLGGGKLYAGGTFTKADNLTVDRLSYWDGAAWWPTGSGAASTIYALWMDGSGNLYAGGSFTLAGGAPANRVARWDGSRWHILGEGFDNSVRALAMDNNNVLYAGGNFDYSGTVLVNNIARWDGTSWGNLAEGVNNTVYALAADDSGNLYVGGSFITASDITVNRIARWDGTEWHALDTGMSSTVNALLWDGNDNLYAGGDFTTAGSTNARRIARWDGNAWYTLGSGSTNGTNLSVRALAMDQAGILYLGGDFTNAGGSAIYRIARWDGTSFSALGSGADATVRTLLVDGNSLYIGGDFFNVDGQSIQHVARWNGIAWSPLGSGIFGEPDPYALALDSTHNIYLGGTFTIVGENIYSSRIALWLNNPPQATDDAFNTIEETPLIIPAPGVLDNDTDPEGSILSAWLETPPTTGYLDLQLDGSFTYTPTIDFNGLITFTYLASDGGKTDLAMVSINITPVNDAPVAIDDEVFVEQDTQLIVNPPGVLGNDYDVDEDPLHAVLDSGPSVGILDFHSDGSFTYTPAAGYIGQVTFTYHASDSQVDSNTATVTIIVYATNGSPIAQDDQAEMQEDTVLNVAAPGVLSNDSDPENDPLTAHIGTPPSIGSLMLNQDGSFIYTPAPDFHGVVTFTYFARDLYEYSNLATVSLTIQPLNDAPLANPDLYLGGEDTTLTVPTPGVLGNDLDVDGDSLTSVLDQAPWIGELQFNPDGSFTYTPILNYTGVVTFTYHAHDATADSNITTVTLELQGVNDPPTGVDDFFLTPPNTVLSITVPGVLSNDSDVDGDPLIVILDAPPLIGELLLNPGGSFVYTPTLDYQGLVSFTYFVLDPFDGLDLAEAVIAVDHAPVANPDAAIAMEDTLFSMPAPGVLGNDSDVDGDPLIAILETPPTYGEVTLYADGSYEFMPALNFTGAITFTYRANDSFVDSNSTTVTITVTGINDPPIPGTDLFETPEETPLVVLAPGTLANDSDPDGDSLSAVLLEGPDVGELAFHTDGSFIYTPTLNFESVVTFTYAAFDGFLASNAVVSITVIDNDNPVVDAGENQTINEGSPAEFMGSFTDPGLAELPRGANPWLDLPVEVMWNFGDGTTASGLLTPTHIYVENGNFTVTLAITDSEGDVGFDSTLVVVQNIAPILQPLANRNVKAGEPLELTAYLYDPGLTDTFNVNLDWGDGESEPLSLDAGSTSFTISHIYSQVGTYTVSVTLTDDDGGQAVQVFMIEVSSGGYTIHLPLILRN